MSSIKTFEVVLEYEERRRDEHGYPVFGTRTMEVVAVNKESVKARCDKVFGRGNYNIVSVEEIDSTNTK